MLQRKIVAGCMCGLLLALTLTTSAARQEPTILSARGKGTIKVGKESFQLHTVVLKLRENDQMELTLVSDITVFFEGSWSATNNPSDGITLKIEGGGPSSVEGGGKVFLREGGKSIARMTLQAANKFRNTIINVNFTAE